MAFGRKKHADEAVAASAATAPADAVTPAPLVADAIEEDEEKSDGQDLAQVKTTATTDIVYPEGLRLALLMIAVFSSLFLVSLDRLIISTAIPQITDDFNSVTDIGWYGSAYLLTNCSFQLLFGKFYGFFSVKFVFLTAILLFEVGSALCGAAPSSTSFIVGRAIAGLGSAGIMSGIIVVLVYAVPLHKRPMYQGLFGAVFGLSSIIGPLVGGAFTSHVTWRWCFYINLPFGGLAMLFIFLLLTIPDRKETQVPLKDKILQLDLYGTTVLLPGCICLLLALQWGGLTYAWSNGRVIALLVLACVLLVAFVVIQIVKPDTATVPPRIFLQRSIMAGFFSTICIGAQMMLIVYYLPIWFQAIKGVDALDSGIKLLPMILPMVFGSITTGILVSRIGYYTPFMIWGVCLMSVGAGLLTTLQVDTGEAKWIGYQVLYGYGMGCTFQAPNLAAQATLPNKDVPIGSSLMFFSQLLGGAIFLSVGQNVFDNQLLSQLSGLQGFDSSLLLSTGATTLLAELPDDIRPAVLFGYNEALRKVFQVALILVCLTILGAAALEWRSVKKNVQKKDAEEAAAAGAAAEEGRGADDAATAAAAENVADREEKIREAEDVDADAATVVNSEKARRSADHEAAESSADSKRKESAAS